jgi:hypothetical protein
MPDDVLEHPEALRGFAVRGVDGPVGVVVDADQASLRVRRRWLRWRRVVIPARAVDRIDMSDRVVCLDRTRREVARIRQRAVAGPRAWFVPASNRLPSGNPVIGAQPPVDDPSS